MQQLGAQKPQISDGNYNKGQNCNLADFWIHYHIKTSQLTKQHRICNEQVK